MLRTPQRIAATISPSIAIGFLTSACAVRAQAAPAGVQLGTPTVASSPARVDPAARDLVNQMAAAYKALQSYSGTLVFSGDGVPNLPRLRAAITFQKPDRIAVTTAYEQGATTRAVADDVYLRVSTTRVPGHYLELPAAAPAGQADPRALAYAGAAGISPTALLFSGADVLARLAPSLRSLLVGAPRVMDGVRVQTVVAAVDGREGPRTLTFYIDKDDHLLRQVTLAMAMDGKPVTLTETHTDVRVNPALTSGAFAFAPPSSARKVTRLEDWVAAARTAAPAPTLAAAGLIVLPGKGEEAVPSSGHSGQQGRYDFGQVSLLNEKEITHTFRLKNTGDRPLTVERLRTTCGCLSTLIQQQPVQQQPGRTTPAAAAAPAEVALATLVPGQEAFVRVTVNLSEVPPGSVRKPVLVYVRGHSEPAAVLELVGTLEPSVTFSPAVLDFGQVPAGAARTLTLTATMDARLTRPGGSPVVPPLASSNPAVRIGPAVLRSAALDAPDSAPTSTQPMRTVQATYIVTLAADAPLGPIAGSLRFVAGAGDASVATQPSAVAAALRSATVLSMGQVIGDVSAQPMALAFGVVPAGQKACRQIVLSARNAATLDKMILHGDDTWLTARLTDARPPSAPNSARTLEITLDKTAPAGALQTRLQVTLSNGQRLIIPVNAYVQPRDGSASEAGEMSAKRASEAQR